MPMLLALIPEDGWAMVAESGSLFFVKPPFRTLERVSLPMVALGDAIAVHGYEAQTGLPEEPWANVIARIRRRMASVRAPTTLPSGAELLVRMMRSGPPSVLTDLLATIENDYLPRRQLRAAGQVLKQLLAETRVKENRHLLDRALALRDTLDDLREQLAGRAPTHAAPPRIAALSMDPRLLGFRSQFIEGGTAVMVTAGP